MLGINVLSCLVVAVVASLTTNFFFRPDGPSVDDIMAMSMMHNNMTLLNDSITTLQQQVVRLADRAEQKILDLVKNASEVLSAVLNVSIRLQDDSRWPLPPTERWSTDEDMSQLVVTGTVAQPGDNLCFVQELSLCLAATDCTTLEPYHFCKGCPWGATESNFKIPLAANQLRRTKILCLKRGDKTHSIAPNWQRSPLVPARYSAVTLRNVAYGGDFGWYRVVGPGSFPGYGGYTWKQALVVHPSDQGSTRVYSSDQSRTLITFWCGEWANRFSVYIGQPYYAPAAGAITVESERPTQTITIPHPVTVKTEILLTSHVSQETGGVQIKILDAGGVAGGSFRDTAFADPVCYRVST